MGQFDRHAVRSSITLRRFISAASMTVCVLAVWGCSKAVTPKSETDTPENHYATGMDKLAAGDFKVAEEEFTRAVKLAPKGPRGYTGMAFLELGRGNYDEALSMAEKAVGRDGSFVDAHTALGAAYCEQKRGKDWFERATASIEKALSLDESNQRARFYLARTYMKNRQFERARDEFDRAAVVDGPFKAQAAQRRDIMETVIGLLPLPECTGDIFIAKSVDRGELCQLIIEVLGIRELLRDERPVMFEAVYNSDLSVKGKVAVPTDVAGHRLRDWIMAVLPLNLDNLRILPNGYFYPDMSVTRAQLADILQDIIVRLSGEERLATQYIGSETRFPDVRSDFFAFNAITLAYERGLIGPAGKSGAFDPKGNVSGIVALKALRALQQSFFQ